jgi:hypothetical protein
MTWSRWILPFLLTCSGDPGEVPPPACDLSQSSRDVCGECWDWCGELSDFESVFWCSQECNAICARDETPVRICDDQVLGLR